MNIQCARLDQPRFWREGHLLRSVLLCVPWVLIGCGDPYPSVTAIDRHAILQVFTIQPRGLTLARDSSYKLVPEAWDIRGEPIQIPDTLPVEYTSEDPNLVAVDERGIVTAIAPTPYTAQTGPAPIPIIATWSYYGVTRIDTIYVAVTETLPAKLPAQLRLAPEPYPKDSTWTASVFGSRIVPTHVLTANGDTLREAFVYLWTDSRVERINDIVDPISHFFVPYFAAGSQVWIHASATVYGVTFRDSLLWKIIDPAINYITIMDGSSGSESVTQSVTQLTLFNSPCASLVFSNTSTIPVKITLDKPDKTVVCVEGDETGDIGIVQSGSSVIRKFRESGTYQWRVTKIDGSFIGPDAQGSIQIRSREELQSSRPNAL